ncbi:pantoate--beta-alanine ligase [uncultured Winogradskyella sp.]|uniref:pantoate--beta-alanine ligase n=1 Tax=uncultured Winogradskyella sp. TaxID=395353 RepID=UPI0025FFFE11|nr:pantoate--beta-alanine ligase [uncultured Winogradskyella sp.]
MKVFNNKNQLSNCVDKFKTNSKAIGFVPTMGALHNGHLSLVEKGLLENDFIVVSIFVNPTQFNNKEDLERYPRTVNRDLALLETVSKSKIIVFIPSIEDIYEDKVSSEAFAFDGLEHEMEGAFRPGHFDGVGTVVKRLLEIVRPDNAYFGEKDFQQLQIIKKMIELHKLTTKIVGCAIYRADDGLAMSSRNERLKPNYRKAAPFIYKTLKDAKKKFGTDSAKEVTEWVENQFKKHELLELEYFLIADIKTLKPVKRKSTKKTYRAFIAAYADDIRLIDNIALN